MKKQVLLGLMFTVSASTSTAAIHVPADQPTIQAGIDAASPGDTVLVACGTYYEHDITIRDGITLRSDTGQADCVVIDAQQSGRVAYSDGGDESQQTLIEGITFTRGMAGVGAGMHCFYSDLILRRCAFVDNVAAGQGGGLYFYYSRFDLQECEFRENLAGSGGGLFSIYCWSNPTITGCVFSSNQATLGGGYYDDDDDVTILSSIFSGNQAQSGGAIYSSYANLSVVNCTIVENTAGDGSGLYVSEAGSVAIESSILAFGMQGPAVQSDEAHVTFELHSCDLYGNEGGDWVGSISDQLGVDCNISLDPQFCGVPGSGDYTLQNDSPCAPANSECGVLIGALSVQCGEVSTQRANWSSIKSLY